MSKIDELCINTIRVLAIEAVERAKSGHPGMPMGDAAMAYILWSKFLRHNPKNPLWLNRDRFILSAGHGSMLLYSLLFLTGHDISLKDLMDFRQWGSKTPGHPEYHPQCGIETTTGPLGQGFATGVGMAIAEKYLSEIFNKPGFPIFDYWIYGIVSDGDLMEGVSSEAASLAGHLGLRKIIYLYSDNKITIEGSTELSFTEDVRRRFHSYGWHTEKVDGNNLLGVAKAISNAKKDKRPSLIIARTHIAYGSPTKMGTPEAHGAPLGKEEIMAIKESIGFPKKEFYVPKEALRHMRKAVERGKSLESKWRALLLRYKKKYPSDAKRLIELSEGRLPDGWENSLPVFKPEDGSIATRVASGKALNAIADALPQLIGGSADLAPSNNTYLKKYPDFGSKRGGRNLHFGVREHAMGAALNGIALSKMLIPYGGTFLVFSDYLRPAERLSALMGLRVIYVFTHDSIGLGEDGPTHQPIEHLTCLRAMPNMTTIRPADANETVEAWKIAIENTTGPTALILSRQGLPVLDRNTYLPASEIKRGAYVLLDSAEPLDIILIASGSEVHSALESALTLKEKGISVRVVNMASFELFEKQDRGYKDMVLPPVVRKRLAIEAGSSLSWHKYIGLDGRIIGIDRFGASAPQKVLFKEFGFTKENILSVAEDMLRASG